MLRQWKNIIKAKLTGFSVSWVIFSSVYRQSSSNRTCRVIFAPSLRASSKEKRNTCIPGTTKMRILRLRAGSLRRGLLPRKVSRRIHPEAVVASQRDWERAPESARGTQKKRVSLVLKRTFLWVCKAEPKEAPNLNLQQFNRIFGWLERNLNDLKRKISWFIDFFRTSDRER